MAEPVRETVKRSISEARGDAPERPKVGLAENAEGVPFQCGTCEYFEDGTCHNPDPELKGRDVDEEWCCDFYEHDGMKVIVK